VSAAELPSGRYLNCPIDLSPDAGGQTRAMLLRNRIFVKEAGIHPVYFGVLFIVNNSIGLITPPVGTVLNVVAGVTRTSMEDVMKGVWPFLLAQLVVLFLMVLFPQLVTVPARWIAG
jgi:TRAP-type C4-dicarboxylate transport system permease large subunit